MAMRTSDPRGGLKRPRATKKGGRAMDQRVAKLNIEHFKARLEGECDAETRAVLVRLLVEEQEKLALLSQTVARQKDAS